jgi:hypothetical protein
MPFGSRLRRSPALAAALAIALSVAAIGSARAQSLLDPTTPLALPASSYFIVTEIDPRMCPSPLCGGVYVQLVNRAATLCADGTYQKQCYAPILDWSALGLDIEAEGRLETAFRARHALARGTLEIVTTPFGRLPGLVVSDAWLGVTGNEPWGRFFGLLPSGIVCITDPCPSLISIWLNRPRRFFAHSLDLAQSGATPEQIAAGLESLVQGPGLLVVGKPRKITGPAGIGFEIVAREFYTKVEARVGGSCGGFLGIPCDPGEFCDPAPNQCGGADLPGVCKAIGDFCPQVFDPVCGCDGVTYPNDCERIRAQIALDHVGACDPARP